MSHSLQIVLKLRANVSRHFTESGPFSDFLLIVACVTLLIGNRRSSIRDNLSNVVCFLDHIVFLLDNYGSVRFRLKDLVRAV